MSHRLEHPVDKKYIYMYVYVFKGGKKKEAIPSSPHWIGNICFSHLAYQGGHIHHRQARKISAHITLFTLLVLILLLKQCRRPLHF